MTDWEALARPWLRGLEAYSPGQTRDELKAQHGLDEVEPLNWNEDMFGAPDGVLEAAAEALSQVSFYPERSYADFRDAVAEWVGVPTESVIPAHGAQALIGALTSAFIDPGTPVVIPKLTYGLYAQVSAAGGAVVTRVEPAGLGIDLEAVAHAVRSTHARLAWLCDPDNPTGTLMDAGEWRAFLDRLPGDCVVVADEAYMDFADPSLRAPRLEDVIDGRPVVVVRSFSKIFGLAGLRLGYAVADPQVARLMHIVQEPFNVNRVALAAGRAAVAATGFVEARRAEVAEARDVLTADLTASGFRCHPSQANFVLVELGTDDQPVCDRLASRGMLIRGGTEFGLPGFARITVAPPSVMRQAAAAVAEAVSNAS